jgi:hypothetical protein
VDVLLTGRDRALAQRANGLLRIHARQDLKPSLIQLPSNASSHRGTRVKDSGQRCG